MSNAISSQSGHGVGGTDCRALVVNRVANAFQTLGNQSGTLKLRLSPPDLGSLQVEVRIDQGQLTAHLQAETPEARTMLLDNLPALRIDSTSRIFKVARFDVDLMGRIERRLAEFSESGCLGRLQHTNGRNDSHDDHDLGRCRPGQHVGFANHDRQ